MNVKNISFNTNSIQNISNNSKVMMNHQLFNLEIFGKFGIIWDKRGERHF